MERLDLQLSRKQVLKVIFLVTTVLASISLAETVTNYVDFCNALANFQLQVNDVYFSLEEKRIDVTVNLTISNPTRYSGFLLEYVSSNLQYEGEPHNITISPGHTIVGGSPYQVIVTKWWKLPVKEVSVDRPILPYSKIDIIMDFNVAGEDAQIFKAFFEKQGQYQEYIRWKLDSNVMLNTPTFVGSLFLEFSDLLYPS